LSSVGLAFACGQQRRRGWHPPFITGIAVVLFLLGIPFWIGSGLLPGLFFGSGAWIIPGWVLFCIACAAVAACLLVVAGRKLFSPGERAFSYSQFAVLYLATLCFPLVAPLLHAGVMRPGTPAFSDLVEALCAVFLVGGILMQVSMIFSRPEIGSERWQVRQAHPGLRGLDESILYVAGLTLAGAGIVVMFQHLAGLSLLHAAGVVSPLVVFLALHAGGCKLLLKRVESESRCMQVVVAGDVAVLCLPVFFNSRLRSLSGLPLLDLVANLSPLKASESLRSGPDAGIAICAALLLCVGAVLVWGVALKVSDRYPVDDVQSAPAG
jgi:hypothetical protein